jgi:hypothetical protein
VITTTRPVAAQLDPEGRSGIGGLDLERLSKTLSALEFYVDSILEIAALRSIDPWTDDEMTEARLACL